ncbi:hypothetical protein ZEAMMB73_Zm00001d049793 [Zea mays]|uniref:Uncharacterized protein n=1 Tax=Zea mays TaxID=4577 RepID=A0A1D6PY74_MAIZE|nr:hypothetical protein ZEAMMB73_Zm00001d049793 [Zea mays]
MKSHRAGGNRSPIPSTGAQPRSPSTDLVLTFHSHLRRVCQPVVSRLDHVVAEASRAAGGRSRGSGAGRTAVWDTESSLYDSYELAAVRRLLDKRLLALRDAEETRGKGRQLVVVPVVSSRGVHHRRKATLRALFRAVATCAAPPRQAPPLACACAAGMVHDHQGGSAVEPEDLPSHGQL